MQIRLWMTAVAAVLAAVPAEAQVSELESFINAVRARDGTKAIGILNTQGTNVLNRRSMKGETALIIAINQRDPTWTSYLLRKGADANLSDKDGETPLIAAARIGFVEAVEWLLASGAKVDGTNRMGETALIQAVTQKRPEVVKILLAAGADPDKTDAAAGYSAREYAKRDTRNRELLTLIEASRPKAKTLDAFKLE